MPSEPVCNSVDMNVNTDTMISTDSIVRLIDLLSAQSHPQIPSNL